ncbi:MAG: transposase [Chloroflexota bacterium]
MCLKPQPFPEMPAGTLKLASKLLPDTNMYRQIGDKLADFICDQDFVDLYPVEGKPALSPTLLALVTVFQMMEGLSDRQAAAQVVTRIDWKYALHLPLDYAGFNYSVLSEFRDRLVVHKASCKVFDQMLVRLKELGLISKHSTQRTDSLAIIGAVRQLSRLELVLETVRVALEGLEKTDRAWFKLHIPDSWGERYGQPAQQERLVKTKGTAAQTETRALIRQTGQDGQWLIALLKSSFTPLSLQQLPQVAVLQQVWDQQFEVVEGNPTLREKVELPTSQIIETPHDPEVHYSQKRNSSWKGYKVQVTETVELDKPHLITDVTTTLATTTDGEVLQEIQQKLEGREVKPAVQLGDMGYVNGENLHNSQLSGIELVGPIRADTSLQARTEGGVSLEQFELDYQKKTALCPGGKHSISWSQSEERGQTVVKIKFSGRSCAECFLYELCVMGNKNKSTKPPGRLLKLRAYHQEVVARRKEQKQETFKAAYRQRSGVEASLSELVRGHGLRVARYIGLAKESLRNLLIGTGANLKRAARWLGGIRPIPLRKRGLASLGGNA